MILDHFSSRGNDREEPQRYHRMPLPELSLDALILWDGLDPARGVTGIVLAPHGFTFQQGIGIQQPIPDRLVTVTEILESAVTGRPFVIPPGLLDLGAASPFSLAVLKKLASVPRGYCISYNELSRAAGSPHGGRAVGNVMAWNPFPLMYPCHRVIRQNGDLGNYRYGTGIKRRILTQEGVVITGNRVNADHWYLLT